jgi:hypothetical protein
MNRCSGSIDKAEASMTKKIVLSATIVAVASLGIAPAYAVPSFTPTIPQGVQAAMQQTCEDALRPNPASNIQQVTGVEEDGSEELISRVPWGEGVLSDFTARGVAPVAGGPGYGLYKKVTNLLHGMGKARKKTFPGTDDTFDKPWRQSFQASFDCQVTKVVGSGNTVQPEGLQTYSHRSESWTQKAKERGQRRTNMPWMENVNFPFEFVLCKNPEIKGKPFVWYRENTDWEGTEDDCSRVAKQLK